MPPNQFHAIYIYIYISMPDYIPQILAYLFSGLAVTFLCTFEIQIRL